MLLGLHENQSEGERMQISLFHSAMSTRPTVIDSEDLFENIKAGTWKGEIGALRGTLQNSGKAEYDKAKKELYAVTLSGLFQGRTPETMVRYSGLLQGDIDNVEDPETLRDSIALDPHVRASFLSPSGRGVKVAICVSDNPEHHRDSFLAAKAHFKEKFSVDLDKSCSDIARLLFISYDPDLKGNEDCTPLLPGKKTEEKEIFFDSTKIFEDPTKTDYEKAEYALANIDPDDYKTWFSVACSLKSMLGEQGFHLWDAWSQKSPKYNAKEMRYKWETISQAGGITGGTVIGLGGVEELPPRPRKKKTQKKAEETVKALDASLLRPPGWVGDWAEFICKNSRYPQPELALANALTVASCLLGRKIRDQSDVRPNIYIIAVAETAMGKEAARKYTKQLFSETGIIGFGGEKLSSKTAIERTLSATPNALYVIDEFSHYVASLLNEKSASHLKDVMTCFMELYSSSTSTYFGQDMANRKGDSDRFVIDQPSASIYATTTGVIWDQLSSRALRDGTLNRFLVVTAPDSRPKINDFEIVDKLPRDLTNLAHQFSSLSINPGLSRRHNNLAEVSTPSPKIIRYEESAKKYFLKFEEETLKRADNRASTTAAMWGRASELSKKVALIIAGTRFADKISGEEAEYGCELVRHLISNTCVQIVRYLSDNDSERESKRLEQIIRNSGDKGVSASRLIQKTRFIKSRATRKAMIDDLFESELINKEERREPGSQRSTLYYFCE